MGKLIIDNRSSADDTAVLRAIELVMLKGRISHNNTQYCYVTVTTAGGRRVIISTELNKQSDRFVVVDDRRSIPTLVIGEQR